MTVQQLHDLLVAAVQAGHGSLPVYADVPEDPEGWRHVDDGTGLRLIRDGGFLVVIAEDDTDPSFL